MIKKNNQGLSLIELVFTIAVLSIGLITLAKITMFSTSQRYVPIYQQQALSIAQSYLNEIMQQHFSDPNQVEIGLVGAEAGEIRANFDDIQDYSQLPDNVVRDHNNFALPKFDAYQVTVNIQNAMMGNNNIAALRIDVAVSHKRYPDIQVLLSAYRTGDLCTSCTATNAVSL